jgi:hypothetical protein
MVSKGEIKPDPERLKPLRELPAPVNLKAQKRAVGLFSYYSQWIKDFSKKIRPLSQNTLFPLPEDALRAFNLLKEDVENGVVGAIDESYPFQVETDASDHTLCYIESTRTSCSFLFKNIKWSRTETLLSREGSSRHSGSST